MAKISTIIPAYNCADHIRETIESVFSQTVKDMELIVVDDGSADKTGDVLQSFGSKLRHIRHKENRGPSAARNSGVKESKGEYIAFLDHDDVWLPDKIEEQLKLFEKNKDLGLVYSNFYYVDMAGAQMGELFDNIKPHRGLVFEKLIMSNFIPTSSVMVRKKVLDEVGLFDENFLISQDYDLYIRIAERCRIDFVERPLLKYRVHPASFSTRRRKLALDETICITKFYRDKVRRNNGQLARRLDNAIAKYMFYKAVWSLENDTRLTAIKEYLESLRTGAFDYKIALGSVFFLMPRFISGPLTEKLMKVRKS